MKHLKLIILSILFALTVMPVMAQSTMTDAQIIEYVQKENEKGVPRSTIVTSLMEKGVTVDRIQKLRRNYEKQKKNAVGSVESDSPGERMRKNNGQQREEKENPNFKNQRKPQPDPSKMTKAQRNNLKQKQSEELDDETDWLFPDSMQYYDYAEPETEKIKVYGRDIFNNKEITFAPEMNIAAPVDYVLGPGDEVYIDVYGATTKEIKGVITPEGKIVIEDYGPVSLSGLTVAQANNRLRSTIGKRYGGSRIELTVGQTRSITVNVMGEVKVPGTYTLSAFASVFHALYMAGGTNDLGTMRSIKVFRDGKCISTVDLYDYMLNGRMNGNVTLASNDVIIVGPYECLVSISGKVKRPMIYEMKSTESVGTLLNYAGGFTGDAYEDNITLIRKKGGFTSVYSLGEFDRDSFQLCDADSVSIESSLNRYSNSVEIKGAVHHPGFYQIDSNISTVGQLIVRAGGLTEEALGTRGIMHRRKADRSLRVQSFNTKGILNHEIADIPLANEDVVYIPSLEEQNAERILTIDGEIVYPGVYNYAEDMSIEDLILQAGGMKDNASMAKVDVMRRYRDNNTLESPDAVAEFFTFSVKEGFVVDGKEGFKLLPFDEVYVRQSPGNVEQQHVTVLGEAVFVGTYGLTKRNSRLSDIIKLCGGVTSQANLNGARLLRRLTAEDKVIQRDLINLGALDDSLAIANLEVADTRYVGIDLKRAIEKPGDDRYDIILQDGDVLSIPQYDNTVTINGEVRYPNTVAYQAGKSLSYYVNQAGGFNAKARTHRVFAINMNGTVTRIRRAKHILPGCNIVVPAKRERSRLTTAQTLSIFMSMASMAAVIVSAIK